MVFEHVNGAYNEEKASRTLKITEKIILIRWADLNEFQLS